MTQGTERVLLTDLEVLRALLYLTRPAGSTIFTGPTSAGRVADRAQRSEGEVLGALYALQARGLVRSERPRRGERLWIPTPIGARLVAGEESRP